MKKYMFFCDIVGTFDSQRNDDRPKLLNDFFKELENLAKKDNATFLFSFISGDQPKIVKDYICEVKQLLDSDKFPHIKLGDSFADGEIISRELLCSPCPIVDKANLILRQTFIEQQRIIINIIEQKLAQTELSLSTREKLEQQKKSLIRSAKNCLKSYDCNIAFIKNGPISKIFFADDTKANHYLLSAFIGFYKNSPELCRILPNKKLDQNITCLPETIKALKNYILKNFDAN